MSKPHDDLQNLILTTARILRAQIRSKYSTINSDGRIDSQDIKDLELALKPFGADDGEGLDQHSA